MSGKLTRSVAPLYLTWLSKHLINRGYRSHQRRNKLVCTASYMLFLYYFLISANKLSNKDTKPPPLLPIPFMLFIFRILRHVSPVRTPCPVTVGFIKPQTPVRTGARAKEPGMRLSSLHVWRRRALLQNCGLLCSLWNWVEFMPQAKEIEYFLRRQNEWNLCSNLTCSDKLTTRQRQNEWNRRYQELNRASLRVELLLLHVRRRQLEHLVKIAPLGGFTQHEQQTEDPEVDREFTEETGSHLTWEHRWIAREKRC